VAKRQSSSFCFVDTAKYIYEDLYKNMNDKKVEILTGRTSKEERKRILMEFANNPNNTVIPAVADDIRQYKGDMTLHFYIGPSWPGYLINPNMFRIANT
jgi:hypothetical protein